MECRYPIFVSSQIAVILTFLNAGTLSLAYAQERELIEQVIPPTSQMAMTLNNGQLTGRIQNYPLGAVLEELGLRTKIAIVTTDDIGEHRVSVELEGISLAEGLRRLLKDYDTFFYYGGIGDQPSSLRAVWVYPKGSASALQPVPPETWASTKDLTASLSDPNPDVRERAYAALMSRPDRESREIVLHAIRGASEPDSAVRERILSNAFSTGMQLPSDLLVDLARWDASDGIRLMVLDALAGDPLVTEVAQAALSDSNQAIRQRAREILAGLDAAEDLQNRGNQSTRPQR